jgi:hypothetical protein
VIDCNLLEILVVPSKSQGEHLLKVKTRPQTKSKRLKGRNELTNFASSA